MEVPVTINGFALQLRCGKGYQTVQWLATVAMRRYEATHLQGTSRFQVLDVRDSLTNTLLLPRSRIMDVFLSGTKFVVRLQKYDPESPSLWSLFRNYEFEAQTRLTSKGPTWALTIENDQLSQLGSRVPQPDETLHIYGNWDGFASPLRVKTEESRCTVMINGVPKILPAFELVISSIVDTVPRPKSKGGDNEDTIIAAEVTDFPGTVNARFEAKLASDWDASPFGQFDTLWKNDGFSSLISQLPNDERSGLKSILRKYYPHINTVHQSLRAVHGGKQMRFMLETWKHFWEQCHLQEWDRRTPSADVVFEAVVQQLTLEHQFAGIRINWDETSLRGTNLTIHQFVECLVRVAIAAARDGYVWLPDMPLGAVFEQLYCQHVLPVFRMLEPARLRSFQHDSQLLFVQYGEGLENVTHSLNGLEDWMSLVRFYQRQMPMMFHGLELEQLASIFYLSKRANEGPRVAFNKLTKTDLERAILYLVLYRAPLSTKSSIILKSVETFLSRLGELKMV